MGEPGVDPREVERVFDLVADVAREARGEALDDACGVDHALRAEVERLLEMDDSAEAEGEIRRRMGDELGSASRDAAADPLLGGVIGRYRIVDVLGRGGFGIVYLAEQTEPVRRRVAVKVLKAGMDSEAVLGRFEAERQSLALMDHPNIAAVYDAGTTDRGLPYFVMEHVKGVPITVYCDRERLSVDERVELFALVCDAVQHAHHKGVIHRDLKPSNVLVMWDGSRAVPKIIDFGIARAAGGDSSSSAGLTRQGQLVGTPEYMSPEQASPGHTDIDTRTDVYSLGVVLYELLTGALPIEPVEIRAASLEGIAAMVRDTEAVVPSRRLRGLPSDGETTLATVARARGTTSRRLGDVLRRDLDWVVMKCLEKRRDRRYDTPSALAQDLRRFLGGEAVLAGPPSVVYRAGKFVGRHRASVVAGGLVLAALVVGLGSTAWMWSRASASAERARAAEAASSEVAGALIEEFHASVLPLPGSSRARERLVSLGVSHLEGREEGALDPGERLLVARGYDLLGDVEAGLRTPNRGSIEAARGLYERAEEIRIGVERVRPGDPRVAVGLAASALRLGDLLREERSLRESVEAYRRGLARLDGLGQDDAGDLEVGLLRADLLVALANSLGRLEPGDGAERGRLLNEAERVTRGVVASSPTPEARDAHARALQNLGEFEAGVGSAEERSAARAIGHLEAAARLYEALFLEDPVNAQRRRDLAGVSVSLGVCLVRHGEVERGRVLLESATGHFEFLVEADPSNVEARARLSQCLEARSVGESDPAKREALVRGAVEQSQRVVEGGEPSRADVSRLATQRALLARRYIDREAWGEAAVELAASVQGAVRSAPGEWNAAFTRELERRLTTWQYCLQKLDGAAVPASTRGAWLDVLAEVGAAVPLGGADGGGEGVSRVAKRVVDCRTIIERRDSEN